MRGNVAPATTPAAEGVWSGLLEGLDLVASSKEMDAGLANAKWCMCMSFIFYLAALADSSLFYFPLYDRILSPTTMVYTGATLSPPSRAA